MTVNPGASFAILVDGVVRSYRDDRAIALEAAGFLKSCHPHSQVAMRDDRDGGVVPVMHQNEQPLKNRDRRWRLWDCVPAASLADRVSSQDVAAVGGITDSSVY